MPSINDLKKSKFLTKNDVEPPILATIESYEQLNVAVQGADEDLRWCLHFKEVDKPLVINSTNGQIVAKITGSDDFEGWIGQKIVLYNDPNVGFGGKVTGGIRVRAPKKVANVQNLTPVPANLNPNGTRKPNNSLPANFNPNTDTADEVGGDDVPF